MTGCTKKGVSIEEMEREVKGFNLPQQPQPGKSLVYAIYDHITPGIFPFELEISYNPSTAEKVESEKNKSIIGALAAEIVKDISSIGADNKDTKVTNWKHIGFVEPGQYKAFQMNPGYYKFNVIPTKPEKSMVKTVGSFYMKLEPKKTYFMIMKGDYIINRYAGAADFFLRLTMNTNSLQGKYMLSKNFKENLP